MHDDGRFVRVELLAFGPDEAPASGAGRSGLPAPPVCGMAASGHDRLSATGSGMPGVVFASARASA